MHGGCDTQCDARSWVLDLLHGPVPERGVKGLDEADYGARFLSFGYVDG
ncbi:unnamed protein product [Ciceribacter sp. T2.26MG-112.2]|nr:unnamed protein product [Ciceribacter naphthalenivorans]